MSSSLHDSPLHDSHLHDSLQLDSNKFCTTLRLPGRVYEAVEPPDNPKAIIHHSKIDYVEKRRVLTQGEDFWFNFSDQPMRFSLREFHLITGLRCEEDQTITEPQFKIMKKPYLWMLGKNDKFTVRTLYEKFKEKARSMPTLERLSFGTTIITEAVIMAENPSSKIPRGRLQRYMNYRLPKMAWGVKSLSASSWIGDSYEVSGFALAIHLWAMSSVNVLGKSLGKPCETSSSPDSLCLHWDSTRTPTITEVLELEKINNVEVSTMIGLAEEYKHLVEATHSDDADFHSVVKLVQQGYKMRRSDWENGFVDMFVATEDIGQQRKTKDEDAEHGEDLNHSEDEEENKDEEEKTDAEENKDGEDKTDEEENKDEEYQKDKEHRKDKDHSMSNSEKLDKLIQMVRDLDKRVVVIQNVLGVKFNDGSPNKEHCENIASSGDRRSAKDYENEEDTIDEEANSGDKKSALDDENEEEICDEEAKSGVRKKHPILHPFEPVDKTRKEKMREWKMSNKKKKLRINQEIVTAKWFSDIKTPGKKAFRNGFELLKLRQINNPDLFLNKTALVVGVKFLEEIDELYDEFLDDKKGFQFGTGFDKYNIEKTINFLYSTIVVAEKYLLGVVVNLEKRSITAFNCAAMKFADASLVPYDNAYAMALPFMIRNFFKDVSMDTNKLSIKIVSEGFPQVLKIEDSGVYALKLIECHAMRIVDLTKLSEEKIAIIREKLVVDIFSELQ
uniref:Ubiquitin-like protease family profile domain-containing protein n=1 Tax=Brassica oleracea var. oleracea TaxID=109376 RepID=A0A0D3CWN6_BRAOL